MPSSLSRVFTALSSNPIPKPERHLPMLNSLTNSIRGYLNASSQTQKKKKLMSWAKSIPELTALALKVSKDIVGEYYFEPVNPNESGRNKVMRANRFALETSYRRTLKSQTFDALITGEGFGWKGKLLDRQVRGAVKKCVERKLGFESKAMETELMRELKAVEGFADTSGVDEDLLRPRLYRYMPSSTMETIHDEYDIKSYDQIVGGSRHKFMPDEVIRITFEELDGKVNGFSPVESIVVQLELLRQMWQNQLSLHKNGGAMDRMFILKNTKPNSDAYKRIEEQLMKYKLVENRHGNLLFTGEVGVEEIGQIDKMQFMDQGLYITGLVAMLWEVPRSSIPYIVGGTNTKDDTGGNSERGYWRRVSAYQSIQAEIHNQQLWIPYFGVRMVFKTPYTNDDVQTKTAEQLHLNNILTTDTLLATSGKKLSLTKRLRLLGLSDADIEDNEIEELGEGVDVDKTSPGGVGTRNQLSKNEISDNGSQSNIRTKKAKEQNNSAASRGAPPSGR